MKTIVFTFVVLLLWNACSPDDDSYIDTNYGEVRVHINSGARTINPDWTTFNHFRLTFIGEALTMSKEYTVQNGQGILSISMKPGFWTLIVSAYSDNGDKEQAHMQGNTTVTVESGKSVEVTVALDNIVAPYGTMGTFSYSIQFPESLVTSASLHMSFLDQYTGNFVRMETVNLIDTAVIDNVHTGILTLPSGYYLMNIQLSTTYPVTGRTDIVYIYPNMETKTPQYTFTEQFFPHYNEVDESLTLDNIKEYLDALSENTVTTPYEINIAIDVEHELNTLYDLLDKYVVLDLSGGSGNTFGTVKTAVNTEYIVSITVPDTVTAITDNAFSGYTALKYVEMENVTTVPAHAFADCDALETLKVPSLKTVVSEGVDNLKRILFALDANTPETPYTVEISTVDLSKKPQLEALYAALIRYVNLDLTHCSGKDIANCLFDEVTDPKNPNMINIVSIIFPTSVETINNKRFTKCTNLVSVQGEGVTTIKTKAFAGCTALKSINFPSVTKIECNSTASSEGVFYNCSKLTDVEIPRIEELGNFIFYNCSSLQTLNMPEIQSIGKRAFKGSGISSITLGETVPTLGEKVFEGINPLSIMYVPADKVEEYRTTTVSGWTDELKAQVTQIPAQ